MISGLYKKRSSDYDIVFDFFTMSSSNALSPTVALVIDKFKAAMLADSTLDDDMAERIVAVLLAKGATTAPKITSAMFVKSEEEGNKA